MAFHGKISAAASGLALSYAAQLSGIFQFTVRLATDTQARFVSVERIYNFIHRCKLEEPEIFERLDKNYDKKKLLAIQSLKDMHPNWPTAGHVKFDSVYMNYSLNHESVLKDLCFEALPGETIGRIKRLL